MTSELEKKMNNIVRHYIQSDIFENYEEWVAEYESMRNELIELFKTELAQAVKEERERTIHEIGLEFNDLVQNEGSFADYAFETLEWFKKHDKLLHQSEEEK